MVLMKESLRGIISGTEETPGEDNADTRRKFMAGRDCALAIIVLVVDPLSLYLLGDPEDPKAVWKKLEEQLQPKT